MFVLSPFEKFFFFPNGDVTEGTATPRPGLQKLSDSPGCSHANGDDGGCCLLDVCGGDWEKKTSQGGNHAPLATLGGKNSKIKPS